MSYIEYLNKTEKNLKNKNYEDALLQFISLLETIKNAEFSYRIVDDKLRILIYSIAPLIPNNLKVPFVEQLFKLYEDKNVTNKDLIAFILSEFLYDLDKEKYKTKIQQLGELFHLNPDLQHTNGHYFINNDRRKALNYYLLAQKLDPVSHIFFNAVFTAETQLIKELKMNGNIIEAIKFCNEILESKKYRSYHIENNIIYGMLEALEDHKLLLEKINNIDSKIKAEVEKERFKMVEVLSFFSTVIAFILSTVSIAKDNSSTDDKLKFLSLLGLILISFSVGLPFLIKKFDHKRAFILLLLGSILSAGFYFYIYPKIASM
jgi:hypothetical protein